MIQVWPTGSNKPRDLDLSPPFRGLSFDHVLPLGASDQYHPAPIHRRGGDVFSGKKDRRRFRPVWGSWPTSGSVRWARGGCQGGSNTTERRWARSPKRDRLIFGHRDRDSKGMDRHQATCKAEGWTALAVGWPGRALLLMWQLFYVHLPAVA